jgi:hypothetical protein
MTLDEIIASTAIIGPPLGMALLTPGIFGALTTRRWYWHLAKLAGLWTFSIGMLCVGVYGLRHQTQAMDAAMAGMALTGAAMGILCSCMDTVTRLAQWWDWSKRSPSRRAFADARRAERAADRQHAGLLE